MAITMPRAEGDAARTEQALQAAETTVDTSLLDVALRTAAVHLTEAERDLPQLAAAVIGPREIVLHLAEPAEPVPPFTAEPEALERWTCPVGTPEILPRAQTDDVESPYPALISLGWDACESAVRCHRMSSGLSPSESIFRACLTCLDVVVDSGR